jgi:ABC-type branched-subunit amino acid transport system permease subunit
MCSRDDNRQKYSESRMIHGLIRPEALRFVGMPSAIAANMRQIIYGGLLVIFMLFRLQGFIGEYS